MITEPTVFVFGAGLSSHYGFPLGKTLIEEICDELSSEKLTDLDSENSSANLARLIYKALCTDFVKKHSNNPQIIPVGNLQTQMRDLENRLRHSSSSSIDSFLAANPELQDVGKAAIAAIISKYENESALFPTRRESGAVKTLNPYSIIWNQLRDGITNLSDLIYNNVAFITFNYDRSWEYFISTAIDSFFPENKNIIGHEEKRKEILNSVLRKFFPIHIYGKLGNLPIYPRDTNAYAAPYAPLAKQRSDHIAQCISTIHTIDGISETSRQNTDSLPIQEIIRDSKVLYFLGFGYSQSNLKKLNPNNIEHPSLSVYGSAFGFDDQNQIKRNRVIASVKQILKNAITPEQTCVWLGESREDCATFLENRL